MSPSAVCGPAVAESKHADQVPAGSGHLAEATLAAIRRLNSDAITAMEYGAVRDAMLSVFGPPVRCLICGVSLNWTRQVPDDVDPWFCSACCPICGDGA
jgi:hypothetical protein